MTTPRAMRLILLAAVLCIIGAAAILLAGSMRPVHYGWFAYAPLADTTFVPQGGYLISGPSVAGLALLAAGLLALAF